jgi:hypothetical protein
LAELKGYDSQEQARQAHEQHRAEGADREENLGSGDGEQPTPAEPLSRQQYARDMRAGEPVTISEAYPALGDDPAASGTDQSLRRRLAGLEAENAKLATSNMALAAGMQAIEARLERLEHASQDQPVPLASGNEQSRPDVTREEATPQRLGRLPRWASNEAVGLAAAVGGGTLTTVADFARAFPATYAGIGASALGVGAAGLGLYRKHREDKNAAPRRRH